MTRSLAGFAAMGLVTTTVLLAQQPAPPVCQISGRINGAGVPLPGVALTIVEGTATRVVTSSGVDGAYRVSLPVGTYEVRAALTGFDDVTRPLTVGTLPDLSGGASAKTDCAQTLDLTLTLTPRRVAGPGVGRGANAAGARGAATPFQRLDVQQNADADAAIDAAPTAAALDATLLPPGFANDVSGDAIALNGAAARTENNVFDDRLGAFQRGEIQLPPEVAELAASFGVPGQGGQVPPGGFPGGGGRGGARGGGRGGQPGQGRGGQDGGGRGGQVAALGGRGLTQSRYNATADYAFGGSVLDASPYQLRPGTNTEERPYGQHNFGGSIGGPLRLPGLLTGTRTNFTLTYSGGYGSSLYDQYATVPVAAVRAGDFSGVSSTLIDPATGQPFANNQIPADRISPQATALLPYIPLPNLDGTQRNYHYTTATNSKNDSINARITHNFGSNAGGRGGGGRGGGGFGGRGGRGGRGTSVSLNVQMQYRHSEGDQNNTFATLGGTRSQSSLGLPISVNVARQRNIHQFNINTSWSSNRTANKFAYVTNVAGDAGIAGTTTDPSGWGVPNLSFSSITGLRDLTPSERSDSRFSATYSWTRPTGRHQLRFGGEWHNDRSSSDTESNANGTFVFTGVYSTSNVQPLRGTDFADFLLGMPAQASVQYGPGTVTLKGRSVAAYANDDWRIRGNLTLQLGLRYELLWPFIEESGHLVNLDVTPGFTSAAPVMAGEVGLYTGQFPDGLVLTDQNNLAPRLGLAWRSGNMVLRGGYGVSYNAGTYSAIARQLATQPPLSTTNTQIGTLSTALLMENALAGIPPDETTNNYGIDKNYVLGRVQTWNADVSRQLGRIWTAGVNYTHTLGSNLDIVRAPNRDPSGIRIDGVQPFLWQASEGSSALHSGAFRLQMRQTRGFGASVTYTLARSRDNAPSIGGGATTSTANVAQNDRDIEAEWGLSNFDRRHRLNTNVQFDLPFGPNRRWLNNGGTWGALLDGWRITATVLADAGTPLTARVQGASRDIAQGVNGALRADYDGSDVSLDDSTVDQFFNTSAFSIPLTGLFGTSPRNIIIGPGTRQVNAQLARDIRLAGNRALSIQLRVNNLLNDVNYRSVDTNVNSLTFGQVLSVAPLRSSQVNLRFRF